MIRVQIYLTDTEKELLQSMAIRTNKSQSELIRMAIDRMLEKSESENKDRLKALDAAAGLWKDREDLPDLSSLRDGFNRDTDN